MGALSGGRLGLEEATIVLLLCRPQRRRHRLALRAPVRPPPLKAPSVGTR